MRPIGRPWENRVRRWLGRLAPRGPQRLLLTFDDGPHPEHTPRILDALAAAGVTALFFVVGRRVQGQGALLARAVAAGHRLGNHTFSHARLTELAPDEIRDEIRRTHDLIEPYLPPGPPLFRLPYGATNRTVAETVAALGYRMIGWEVDSGDWLAARQPDGWIEPTLIDVRKRRTSRILLHDDRPGTAAHLPRFLARLRELGIVHFDAPAEA